MATLDAVAELKSDHAKVRDSLLELINIVEKGNAVKALEILIRLDKLTGPHFRWEEESFYLASEKFFGREYLEYLLSVHDRILQRAKELAGILGKGELTEEERKKLPGILRMDVLSHPIECEGVAIFAEKLSKRELAAMAKRLEECRKEDVPLLEWGDKIKDAERAKRGLKAKSRQG